MRQTQETVEPEENLRRRRRRDNGCKPIDNADRERSEGAKEGADEAVAGESRRPVVVRDDVGKDGVFEGQKDADVTA